MSLVFKDRNYTVAEYFILEEAGEIRHEFINGNLYEMSGASTEHHLLIKQFEKLFDRLFEAKGYTVFRETMKIKIYDENKYYYVDLFITKEANSALNSYAKHEPELIVEVASESTWKKDSVDKLIHYQKIPSLKYYLIAEQNKPEITVVSRNAKGNWESETFEGKEASVNLTLLDASLPLAEIYV